MIALMIMKMTLAYEDIICTYFYVPLKNHKPQQQWKTNKQPTNPQTQNWKPKLRYPGLITQALT